MNYKKFRRGVAILSAAVALIASCVGVIKEIKNISTEETNPTPTSTINYEGGVNFGGNVINRDGNITIYN